jgi:hypothetical protein
LDLSEFLGKQVFAVDIIAKHKNFNGAMFFEVWINSLDQIILYQTESDVKPEQQDDDPDFEL